MMERVRKQRAKEEYAIVLDYLKHGYSNDSSPFHMKESILQVIGKDHFVLLELIPKPDLSFKTNDEIYIGDGERDQIEYIKGSLKVEKLTQTAKNELKFIVEKLVDANQNNLETMRTSTIDRLVKERGILIGKISHAVDEPENIIFIAPPLILTLDEADQIVETLKDILTSIDC